MCNKSPVYTPDPVSPTKSHPKIRHPITGLVAMMGSANLDCESNAHGTKPITLALYTTSAVAIRALTGQVALLAS